MSDSKPDGGTAFPVQHCGDIAPTKGMTLRDWFAGQAMVLLSKIEATTVVAVAKERDERPVTTMAQACYDMADAMLAAREGRSA